MAGEDKRRETAEGNEKVMEWVEWEHTVCKSGDRSKCQLRISSRSYSTWALHKRIHNCHPFSGSTAAPLISEECMSKFPWHSLCFHFGQCNLERQETLSYDIHLHECQPQTTESSRQDKSPAGILKTYSISCEGWPGLTAKPGSLTKGSFGQEPILGEMFCCH